MNAKTLKEVLNAHVPKDIYLNGQDFVLVRYLLFMHDKIYFYNRVAFKKHRTDRKRKAHSFGLFNAATTIGRHAYSVIHPYSLIYTSTLDGRHVTGSWPEILVLVRSEASERWSAIPRQFLANGGHVKKIKGISLLFCIHFFAKREITTKNTLLIWKNV